MQLPHAICDALNRLERPRIMKDSRETVGQFLFAIARYDVVGIARRFNVAVERRANADPRLSGMSPGPTTPGTFLLSQLEDCFV